MLRLSVLLLAAQGFAAVGGAVSLIVFSAAMNPADFGQANMLISLAMITSLLASGNIEAGAVRVLSQGDGAQHADFIGRSRKITLLAGGILGGVVLVVNIVDRVVGVTESIHTAMEFLPVFFWPFKVLLAASVYVGGLYLDINRKALCGRRSQNTNHGGENG